MTSSLSMAQIPDPEQTRGKFCVATKEDNWCQKSSPTPAPGPAPSPTPSNCSQVVRDCNAALDKAQKAIDAQAHEIDLYKTEVDTQGKQIVELNQKIIEDQSKESAWYRNPVIVGVLGILVGSVTYAYLRK